MAKQTGSIDLKALKAAGDIQQHFWTDSDGAHVTEVTQKEWTDSSDPNYHSGGNTLIDSTTLKMRDGLDDLAKFSRSGLSFKARNEQETFKIDCDAVPVTGSVNCHCNPASKVIVYNDTTTAYFYGLQMAAAGTTITIRIQHGTSTPQSATFTKGTAEIKTVTTTGVTLDYDGNYTFEANNQNTSSHDYKFLDASYNKTWYKTQETLLGNATIDGNTDIYGDLLVGDDAQVCENLTVGGYGDFGGSLAVPSGAQYRVDGKTSTYDALMIKTETFSYSSFNSGNNKTGSEVYTNAGYYPIGVVGVRAGVNQAAIVRAILTTRSNGSCTFSYNLRAVANCSSGSGEVDILWVKL